MNVERFLEGLRCSRDYDDQIRCCHCLPERQARFAEPVAPIDGRLRSALSHEGVSQFYTHQAAAIDAVCATPPIDIVVVTGTASGKTLCYNVPVINALLADGEGRALYLFPTKALAQDQLGALDRLCNAESGLAKAVTASTFDGDTPPARRRAARNNANIILSNPDMLHASILPQHGAWAKEGFFDRLKFVVIDEVHSYRGTFGSHVAGVIRRLRRVCEHYGSNPTFICSSATIANPGELASNLIGRSVHVIDDDGSPRGRKYVVLWNPPFMDRSQLERRSANIEAQRLMRLLIDNGAQTIAFARARVVAELIYKYLREDLLRSDPSLAKRVRPYRGGYLANERRRIEQELFSGRLLGVCSTNALELGIDIGSLDAVIITGFPGTICSIWQQAGRAGRSNEESVAFLVAYNDPIDQYFMRHPEYFLKQSPEHASIDPLNEVILRDQLKCAAAELPLSSCDDALFSSSIDRTCDAFSDDGRDGESWSRWADGRFSFHSQDGRLPQHQVDLRLIGSDVFDIVEMNGDERASIGNVDSISAPELVYPNAIYLHDGVNYLVRELDFEGKIARIEKTDVDYYTQAVLADHCRVIENQTCDDFRDGRLSTGRVDVTWQTIAFKKIKYYTLEVIGQDGLDLPPQTIHTTALWATFPKTLHRDLLSAGFKPIEAMVGVRNLLLVTVPMLAMCDRRDISGCVDSSNLGELAMFVYDRYEGGLGYAKSASKHFGELLTICRQLVEECPCDEGCPSCVGLANVRPPLHTDPDVGLSYSIPNKAATVFALRRWLD